MQHPFAGPAFLGMWLQFRLAETDETRFFLPSYQYIVTFASNDFEARVKQETYYETT